jgi:hypothetical protein
MCTQKENGPLQGHFLCRASIIGSVFVVTVLDDHHSVGVAMTPAFVPAVIAMFAELGACAIALMMVAVPDHDGFSAGDRRCCDSNRAKRCNNVSKLLHTVLLGCAMIKHRTGGNVPREFQENSEQTFSNDDARNARSLIRIARYSMIA